MNSFVAERNHFTIGGAYYPRGHVFAMFPDETTAHVAAHKVATIGHVGAVNVVTAQDIRQAFSERADEVGGMPSVGREDQFMLRYVELARENGAGLLIGVAGADIHVISDALKEAGALLAYDYRALVIDELIDTSPGAEAAAAGKL